MNECELRYVPVEDAPIVNRIECLSELTKSNLRMTEKQQFRRARQIGELQLMRDFVTLGNKFILTAPPPRIPAANPPDRETTKQNLVREIQILRQEYRTLMLKMEEENESYFASREPRNPPLEVFRKRQEEMFEESTKIEERMMEIGTELEKIDPNFVEAIQGGFAFET